MPWCREAVDKYATVDVGFSAVIGSDEHIAYLPRMARELGISSWKFYMAYTQDEASVFGIQAMTDKQVLEGLRVIKGIGYPAMMMVHAENMSIIHDLKAEVHRRGPQRPQGVDRRAARTSPKRRPPAGRSGTPRRPARGSTSCT